MDQILIILLFCIVSYLIGSIPFGVIFGYLIKKVDVRKYGSQNIGTTNTSRVIGLKWGIVVSLLDIFKGAVVIIFVRLLYDYTDNYIINMISFIDDIRIYSLYGLSAVLGHVFPIYLGFRGGKAVATSIGALLAIAPMIGLVGILLFLIILSITGYVSLSSIFSSLYVVIIALVYNIFFQKIPYWNLTYEYDVHNWIEYSIELLSILSMFIIILIRHRSNIYRLITGNERRIIINYSKLFKRHIKFYNKIK